jgi:L-cysteine/cystine lyase
MDDAWMRPLRDRIPVLARCTYLNTGTAGPLPEPVSSAMHDEADWEITHGRGDFTTFPRYLEQVAETRALVARLLRVEAGEIALTHSTSEAVNIVLWGLRWRPGDRVVTTTLEHDAVAVPLGLLAARFGVEVRWADIGHGEHALEAIARETEGGARLVIVSHIVWSTGAVLPVGEIADLAHARGAALLVDGAQSCGALPLDVTVQGADYYTVSGQKWLCGPEGSGALYVRSSRLEEVQVTWASYFSAAAHDYRGRVRPHPDARRFEPTLFHRPALAGFLASLRWAQDDVGVARAHARSLALATHARRRLEGVAGVEVLTPPGTAGPLLAVDLPAFPPAHLHALALALSARGIVCRSIDHPPYALRASFGFFNLEREADELADAVVEAARRGPACVAVPEGSLLPRTRA